MPDSSKKTGRSLQLRDNLWPDARERVWDYQKSDGWLNIPRSMPVILRILDYLTKRQPVSATYFELWCRTYNNGFVRANQPRDMAFFSGFSGERAEHTWLSRIEKLHELGFIDIKEGLSGRGGLYSRRESLRFSEETPRPEEDSRSFLARAAGPYGRDRRG